MPPTPEQFTQAEQAALLASRGVGGAGAHTMSIGPADVHIDTALSNIAVQFRPNEGKFIADIVAPVLKVSHRSNKFFKYAAGAFTDLGRSDIASQMGRPAQSSTSLSTDSYVVSDHGFMDFVPADVENSADAPLRPLMDTTEILTERLLLSREYRVATAFANSANYGANTSDIAGAEWTNPSSEPVRVIESAIEGMIVDPNTLVLGAEVWNALKRHPSIERYILSRASTVLGATSLTVTPELLAAAFGLRRVVIGRAKYNTAGAGAAVSLTNVWGRIAVLCRVEENPAPQRTENFMYTMRYQPGTGSAFETRQWYDHSIGVRGGTWVKVTHSDAEKIVASEAGYLFENAVPA